MENLQNVLDIGDRSILPKRSNRQAMSAFAVRVPNITRQTSKTIGKEHLPPVNILSPASNSDTIVSVYNMIVLEEHITSSSRKASRRSGQFLFRVQSKLDAYHHYVVDDMNGQ